MFYANDKSNLTFMNNVFLGTLPHTDEDATSGSKYSVLIAEFLSPSDATGYIWENFQVVDADAGVAYLTGIAQSLLASSYTYFGSRCLKSHNLQNKVDALWNDERNDLS